MPHLEEQFPPVNPLVLLRPDALDPPEREREEEENNRTENRAEDETPIPGSLADGIDRVTLSANARVIAPVLQAEETVPSPLESTVNPAVPELLNIEILGRDGGTEASAADEVAGTSLQDFENALATRRRVEESGPRIGLNPIEPPATPNFAPAISPVPDAQRATRDEGVLRIENRVAPPAIEPILRDTNRAASATPPPRDPLFVATDNSITSEPAENIPLENPLGLRGSNPEPPDRSVNILTPANVGEDPPGPNILEARNFGEGRTLSLDLESVGSDSENISRNTVDEVLQDAGAIPGPATGEEAPFELLIAPAVQPGFVAEPETIEATESAPNFVDTIEPALPDPVDNPTPAGTGAVASSLIDTRQVLEEDQETQTLQPPAFPELDPDEPFIPNVEPEAREEAIPAVAQDPPNIPPPVVENTVPVAPPVPGNVEALDENPQALRRDNLGTDPALRSNRELRNFLQEFNNRIEPPEQVTESAGGPVTEVQNNAPPPPAVFENLEAASAELLNDLREDQATEGVTRPEEEPTTPPEPRTPESVLTERGQNIDRFI